MAAKIRKLNRGQVVDGAVHVQPVPVQPVAPVVSIPDVVLPDAEPFQHLGEVFAVRIIVRSDVCLTLVVYNFLLIYW